MVKKKVTQDEIDAQGESDQKVNLTDRF